MINVVFNQMKIKIIKIKIKKKKKNGNYVQQIHKRNISLMIHGILINKTSKKPLIVQLEPTKLDQMQI